MKKHEIIEAVLGSAKSGNWGHKGSPGRGGSSSSGGGKLVGGPDWVAEVLNATKDVTVPPGSKIIGTHEADGYWRVRVKTPTKIVGYTFDAASGGNPLVDEMTSYDMKITLWGDT